MNNNLLLGALVAAWAVGQASAAQIVYEGTIPAIGSVTGSVVGDGATNCGLCGDGDGSLTLDFWKFTVGGVSNQDVTIQGTRLDDGLDLAFAVYQGVTTADYSARDNVAIWKSGAALGLNLVAVGDDEIDVPGPYGDPLVLLNLAPGDYTIAVSGGIGSGPAPASNYQLDLLMLGADIDVVEAPEPSTYAMLLAGLAGAAGFARRRKS